MIGPRLMMIKFRMIDGGGVVVGLMSMGPQLLNGDELLGLLMVHRVQQLRVIVRHLLGDHL